MGDRTPPSGVLTFLFTDIEASTWLLQHLGDDYDRVLHEHNRTDYVGLAVHQAARIASAAHGGQVLVSEAALIDAPDIRFIDLGPHRLKDLARAIRLLPGRGARARP